MKNTRERLEINNLTNSKRGTIYNSSNSFMRA
jgi:hypothetical protein